MRKHGWQPPFHPLQTVAIVVFSALAFSFYVFFAPFLGTRTLKFIITGVFTPLVGSVFALYIACTWINPADPGIKKAQEKYLPKKPESTSESSRFSQPVEETRKSLKTFLATHEEGYEPIADTGCQPLTYRCAEKSCCKRKREPDEIDPDEQSLYCSICDAEISTYSKHCRACDKCVHGFDHHCRWLNNCVGTRNYRPFVALMVTCLLMLVLEWAVGIVVLVRAFSNKASFQDEISNNLGRSFPRAAFVVVLLVLTFLALLATAPVTQLFCFHLILMHKGITTYDYILAVREQNEEFYDEADGFSSVTTTPQTSTETGFSGYNSSAGALALAGKRTVFCTPPRLFVDQDQTVQALSDLEVGVGRAGGGKLVDAKSRKAAPVGLNPWKLARVRSEDAASAAARARQKSSILRPTRPGLELAISTDSESSFQSSLSSSGEIKAAPGSRKSRRKFHRPHGLRRDMWSLTRSKRDRITPLSDEDMFAPRGMYPLEGEPRSPYRSGSSFFGDPRASFPRQPSLPPQVSFPPNVLFPRFPGDDVRASYNVRSGPASQAPSPQVQEGSAHAGNVVRASAGSDGYEASVGSGDDVSEAGLSQSWNKASWSKLAMNSPAYATPAMQVPIWVTDYKEENHKPWVTFTAGTTLKPDAKDSPGGLSVSSGSRVEANILKVKPELRSARMHTSSPTVCEESPLRESSDFLSEESTSCCETPDRGTMSSFFYNGPLSVSFKQTSERQMASNRRLMNSIIGSRTALSGLTDDPKLSVNTA